MSSKYVLNTDEESHLPSKSRKNNHRIIIAVAVVVLICFAVALGVGIGVSLEDDDLSPQEERRRRAISILDNTILIDGHNDLPWQYRTRVNNSVYSVDLQDWPEVHTDIRRLREGKLGAQFWAAYVSCKAQYKDAVRQTLEQIDDIKSFVHRYPDTFEFVTTAQGIKDAFKAGKIASLIGVEGGHSMDSSLSTLRMLYELGTRYMTMTHNCNTPWADNNLVDKDDSYDFDGLNHYGEIVVKEMNRLGMMIDLSHVAYKTMDHALRVTKAPVIFSHSSAYALCNHTRNVKDDILEKVRDNDGIVMVNFYPYFVSCNENATLSDVADHIDYIKNVSGVDHVGIGGDYDGVDILPRGLEDVSKYPDLFVELLSRHWSTEDLEKLAGKNLLRVFEAVEKVRDLMANEPPYEDLIPESAYVNNTCRTGF